MHAAMTQSLASQKVCVAGKTVRQAAGAATAPRCRTATAVRASAQDLRRQVLSGMAAGVISLTAVLGAGAIDLRDDRDVRQRGFDIIYEARDLDLDQETRDGLSQYRTNLESTKKRIKESERRIDQELVKDIKKAYWTNAREDLRNQVGNLRFDLNTVIEATGKSKADKKAATQKKKDFLLKVDELDYAIRKKDLDKAVTLLGEMQSALDTMLSAISLA